MVRVAALVALIASIPVLAPAAPPPADAGLTLGSGGARMQTSLAPVPISEIIERPGTAGREAFAIGHAYGTVASGTVFLRWNAGSGWTLEGNAIDETTGRPISASLAALDVTASGVAWAAPTTGGFVRRDPDGRWIALAPPAGSPALNGISLGEDDAGVYGFAVGERGALWRLDDGAWISESLPGGNANAGVLPSFIDVVTIDRQRAIAIGSTGSPAKLDLRERGASGVWAPLPTGQPMFDQPPAPTQTTSDVATVNRSAQPSAASFGDGVTWIAGVIQPVDPQRVIGGGVNRPFVLRYADGAFTSFCPPQYQVAEDGARSIQLCDAPLPFTVGILTDIDAVGTDAIAGGTGLLRYRAGRWERMPSGVGTVQRVSFASHEEGWVTSKPSLSLYRGLSANTQTVGHWTRSPVPTALERWPHVGEEPLVAVATNPSDDTQAMAVGQDGAIVRMQLDLGVERMSSPTRASLHAIAWLRPELAFAVGDAGTILRFDGRIWNLDRGARGLTDATLESIVGTGDAAIAVGRDGTILRFASGAWRVDPASGSVTDRALHAAAMLTDGTELIGGDGPATLFERPRGQGAWRRVALPVGTYDETVYSSMTAMSDGGAIAAGSIGFLLKRDADGTWTTDGLGALASPIHALAARNGTVIAVPGANADGLRIDERGGVADIWGSLMEGPARWVDRSNWTRRSIQPDLDAPAVHDPILSVALDATGRRGWAVGGFPGNVETFDGHRRGAQTTASVWRIDLDGPPARSPSSYDARLPARTGVSFAFLSDTGCASEVCGPSLGSGTRGDRIMLAALNEIARAGARDEITFLGIGGDLRGAGIPDDLAAIEALFDELPIPVFAAIGDRDLRPGVSGNPLMPAGLDGSDPTAANDLYREVFADRPAPWGTGVTPEAITPITVAGSAPPGSGARTHYAFDVTDDDGERIRIAVIDTSQNLALDLTSQNPAEKQEAWLQSMLADARVDGVPVVVLAHEPALVPRSTRTDAANLTAALATGASAVVAGGSDRRNVIDVVGLGDASIALGAFGTGGAPLGAGYRPHRGAYHAWARVTVDPSAANLVGRAPVSFEVFPVLESIALDARDGRVVAAGAATEVRAWGRLFEVGGANAQIGGDADEANATYLRFPFPPPCGPLEQAGPDDRCRASDVAVPAHRFLTSDPSIAAFVARDPDDPSMPRRDANGRLISDPTSGLLCAFTTGVVTVGIESGTHGARIPMQITGGSGPCIPAAIAEPVAVPGFDPVIEPDVTRPAVEPDPPLPPVHGRLPEVAAAAAIAPPPINPAPAPPAGGAGGRQEEHEAASERANFVARQVGDSGIPGPSSLMLLILPALAYVAARAAHERARSRPEAAYRRSSD